MVFKDSKAIILEMSTDRFSNLILGKIFSHKRKYGSVINLKNEKGQTYGLIIGNQSNVIFEKQRTL